MIRRDGRIKWTAAIIVAMLLVAVATAVGRYRDIAAERSAAQALVYEQWRSQGDKNPHAAAHYGIYAFTPVTPLAFFDTGVSNYLGVSIWLEAHRRNRAVGQPAQDMTTMLRFGELTGAYTLQVLLPLFVILLAYPVFAGERETGTLRQVLSTGVTPGQLFIGKGLGILAAVGLLILPLFALGVLALLLTDPRLIPHALLLLLTYTLYVLVYLTLTLALSARARSAQSVLALMVGLWAVVTFAVPRLASDVSRLLFPEPSAVEFQRAVDADLQAGLDGASPATVIEERRRQTLELYSASRIEDLPINFQGVIFSLQEELGGAVFAKHFGELEARMAQQLDVHELFGLISPRLPMQRISMELAGTSLRHHEAFARDAEAFRRDMIEVMNRDLTFNSRPGQTSYRAGPELWTQVGEFAWPGIPLRLTVADLGPSAMTLVLWLVASVLAAGLAARSLKVGAD